MGPDGGGVGAGAHAGVGGVGPRALAHRRVGGGRLWAAMRHSTQKLKP